MKVALLNILVGLVFVAGPAYAQRGMRSDSMGIPAVGFGNPGSFVEHNPPILFHGETIPGKNGPISRTVGGPGGIGHLGIVGDRAPGSRRMFVPTGDSSDRHIFRGGLFAHGRGVVVFAYGVPYFYYPDVGTYDSAPNNTTDSTPATDYVPDPDSQTEQTANQDTDSFYEPGYQWGGELKLYHVTMDQFVIYLKSYILSAPPVQQAAFRSGFVAHFGADGPAMYDQAVQQAISQN